MTHKLLNKNLFLTDGGLETDFIFNKKIDLPHFAAFTLVENPQHQEMLKDYYRNYLNLAKQNNAGFILESPTWRANPDWGYKLGYSESDLVKANQRSIEQLKELKQEFINDIDNILISGQIGPRGDGYIAEDSMTPGIAAQYHNIQIAAIKESGADLVTALTMTNINEALGIVNSAKNNDINVVISFTVETDGLLPSGESLSDAIKTIDEETNQYPLYYMINCAHPSHFADKIEDDADWKLRIKGIRANASCKSHAELDNSTELDPGNKDELGQWHKTLKKHLPELTVYGGCCGTDHSHVEAICEYVLNLR